MWERLHYFSEIKSTHLLIISAGKEARLVLCLLMLCKPQEKPFIRLVSVMNTHSLWETLSRRVLPFLWLPFIRVLSINETQFIPTLSSLGYESHLSLIWMCYYFSGSLRNVCGCACLPSWTLCSVRVDTVFVPLYHLPERCHPGAVQ